MISRGATKYTVGGAGYGPHQLASVSDEVGAFAYDGNGNQFVAPGRTTAYTSFDLPKSVSASTGTSTFSYDAFDRRALKKDPSGTTLYVGNLYERRRGNDGSESHVFKIYADGRVVAQWVWKATHVAGGGGEGGGGKVFAKSHLYLHADVIGSTNVVTDDTGALVDIQRFDPFGRRVNPDDPTIDLTLPRGPPSGVTIGFAGDEEDDAIALVNMRGRMYDPRRARFVTPDPIARPKGQGLNPYSYAKGNPLRNIDPTGFDSVDLESAGEREIADPSPANAGSSGASGASGNRSNQACPDNPGGVCGFTEIVGRPVPGTQAADDVQGHETPPTPPPVSGEKSSPGASDAKQAAAGFAQRVGELVWSNLKSAPSVYSVYAVVRGYQREGIDGALRNLPIIGGFLGTAADIATSDNPIVAANEALNPAVHVYRAWNRFMNATTAEERGAAAVDVVTTVGGVAAIFTGVAEGAPEGGAGAATETDAILARAHEIHGKLDPIARDMRTTAVLATDSGQVVAGGGPDLTPAQRASLVEGEIAAKLPGAHAEITALTHAAKNGLVPRALAVTRAICSECAAAIEASGGRLTSPYTAVWP